MAFTHWFASGRVDLRWFFVCKDLRSWPHSLRAVLSPRRVAPVCADSRWLRGGLNGLVSRKGGIRRYYFGVIKRLRIEGLSCPVESVEPAPFFEGGDLPLPPTRPFAPALDRQPKL